MQQLVENPPFPCIYVVFQRRLVFLLLVGIGSGVLNDNVFSDEQSAVYEGDVFRGAVRSV